MIWEIVRKSNLLVTSYLILLAKKVCWHIVAPSLKVIESVWKPSNTVSLYPGLLKDITEVKCSLPESPVNFGDYGSEGVTAAGLEIAVSNNRINASINTMSFITYDSVCQECNATTKTCTLKVYLRFIYSILKTLIRFTSLILLKHHVNLVLQRLWSVSSVISTDEDPIPRKYGLRGHFEGVPNFLGHL